MKNCYKVQPGEIKLTNASNSINFLNPLKRKLSYSTRNKDKTGSELIFEHNSTNFFTSYEKFFPWLEIKCFNITKNTNKEIKMIYIINKK
jgi:hypothetical protein